MMKDGSGTNEDGTVILFQANIEGKVVSTLKMHDLIKDPPTPLIRIRWVWSYGFLSNEIDHLVCFSSCKELPPSPSSPPSLPTLHFRYLSIFERQEMVAWLEPALFVYHPASYNLPVWTMELPGILSVRCAGNKVSSVYLLNTMCVYWCQ